jgi:hypothetical protein
MLVYFDTTVYSDIEKGKIAKDVVDALREALLTGKLSAHLSVSNIEELLGEWKTDRPAAIRKIRIARDLVGFEKLLKPPNVLLEEAIRAYANGASPPSPFLPEDQRRTVVSSIRSIDDGDAVIDGTVSGIISQVGVLKQTALEQWTEGRREVHRTLSPYSIKAPHPRRNDNNWFLKSKEQAVAEGIAKTVGLDEACRNRGLDGLVNVRAIRLCVNAIVAYVFGITIGNTRQPRAPKWGDDYDLWHIILASTAETFVTYDDRLFKLLTRLPVEGFGIFPSISALLDATLDGERGGRS